MPENPQRFRTRLALPDLAATAALGARIAGVLEPGDVVALAGELGSGKTTLARAILSALGVTEPVPSPTFTLVQQYETPRIMVRHCDLYRIENANELGELGLDEALEEGALLVEWPERAGAWLPTETFFIRLAADGENRRATLDGPLRWRAIGTVDAR